MASFDTPMSESAAPVPLAGLGELSALETALAGPADAARAACHTAQARLARLAQRTGQAVRVGVVPREYALLQAVLAACSAAQEVLDSVGVPND